MWRPEVSLWVIKLLCGTWGCWMELWREKRKKHLLMELAPPPIIASKLWQTVIIHAVEGKRQRERVSGRKSSQGAWVPLMATRVSLVVMGDGILPSHQRTPSLSLGLAGGLSQHKPCPCSSLVQQRDPHPCPVPLPLVHPGTCIKTADWFVEISLAPRN